MLPVIIAPTKKVTNTATTLQVMDFNKERLLLTIRFYFQHLTLRVWLSSISKLGVKLTAAPFVVGIEVNVSVLAGPFVAFESLPKIRLCSINSSMLIE